MTLGASTIEQLLRNHGFELARQNKHKVYKREDGTTFVTASTPSDWRAERNQMSDLARVIGTDKRTLLASLERRRSIRRTATLPEPGTSRGSPASPSAEPAVMQERRTKADTRLAKRLEKIERNRARKAAKWDEKLHRFHEELALLFPDTNEVVFADNRGFTFLDRVVRRRLERSGKAVMKLADQYPTSAMAEEVLTNPNLLCLFNCPPFGLMYVFKDGSTLCSAEWQEQFKKC